MKYLIAFSFVLMGCTSYVCVQWEPTPTGKECVRDHQVCHSELTWDFTAQIPTTERHCNTVCDEYAACYVCVHKVEKKFAPAERILFPDGRVCRYQNLDLN